jgi:hypothetical protein
VLSSFYESRQLAVLRELDIDAFLRELDITDVVGMAFWRGAIINFRGKGNRIEL